MAKEKNILLDISTEVPDRPIVKIDGSEYELSIPDDFVFAEYMWLAKEGQKFTELTMKEGVNGELEVQLDLLVRKAFHDIPDEVFKKLNTIHKAEVLNLFLEAVEGIGGVPRPRQKKVQKK